MHRKMAAIVAIVLATNLTCQQAYPQPKGDVVADPALAGDVLTADQWSRLDTAVEKALAWLASIQRKDGSFPSLDLGQPGVTSLCVMAFLSNGHLPGEGPYGDRLQRAVEFTLACQQENGWIGRTTPRGTPVLRRVSESVGGAAAYNHAISALMLCEVFGMQGGREQQKIKSAIQQALSVTLAEQKLVKRRASDRGGWRYLHTDYPAFITYDSDLSITSWNLVFLRAARNADFEVDQAPIDAAIRYVRSCFDPQYGVFKYANAHGDKRSRGMAGAGVLALAAAGEHNSPEVKAAGDWILEHGFEEYNTPKLFAGQSYPVDRYHYGVFHCTQAMYQLGGEYWEQFFPKTVEALLANQNENGSWDPERHPNDARFGNAYTTALMLMSLAASDQLLPVFQR